MVRFSHSVFALPFALMAAFMAGSRQESGLPRAGQLGLIILCMVAARSFAMTFNRIADAALDARNPRTAGRQLPTGKISRGHAWGFLAGCVGLFLLGCGGFVVWYENRWPIILALPTLFALAAYSYLKRLTILAHFGLGAAIGFSPIAAWIAIHPASLGLTAACLGAAVLLWIAGFDIIYACQDVEVDHRDGLFSIPARWGISRALMVSRACHAATLALLAAAGSLAGLGWPYWIALILTAALLLAEQAVVSPSNLSRVNLAFFTINGCVSLLLGGAVVAELTYDALAR